LRLDTKDYYKLKEENKLNGHEIRKLLFGKTHSGYAFGNKAWGGPHKSVITGKLNKGPAEKYIQEYHGLREKTFAWRGKTIMAALKVVVTFSTILKETNLQRQNTFG
jgi:hypothetical protein